MPGPLTRTGLATLLAGSLLGAGLAGAGVLASGAFADDSVPSASTAAPAPARPAPGPGPRRGPGAMFGLPGTPLHGEFVVGKEGGGTETVLVQSGKVTARDGSTVTLKSSDGFTLKWTVNKDSWVRLGARQGSLDGVAVGDALVATGKKAGDGATATALTRAPAQGAKRGPGRFGPGGDRPGLPEHGRRGSQGSPSPSPSVG
jgi:hypothetical protein